MSSDGRRPDATASYDDDVSRRAGAAAERTVTNVDAIGATSPLRLDESGPEQTIGVDGLPRGSSETPERIGRFVVLHVLGAGGMGVVYAAYDPELDRKVAIKVLIGGAPLSTTVHQRLVREAQAMARLAHPNVVTVHDVGEHDGRVFVAMEYVLGLTLSKWLAKAERSTREILEVFIQAGRGLAAAHAQGLVHRDFKPDNVIVGDDRRVRVMDFGLARGVDAETTDPVGSPTSSERGSGRGSGRISGSSALADRVTRAGSVIGTPLYMAPEQWSGVDVDARTDQFAFCIALFEALHGARPFDDSKGVQSLAIAVTTGERRSVTSRRAVPSYIRDALERGLSTAPGNRFPAMDPLLTELSRDPSRSRRRAALGVALCGIGLAVFGGYQWTQSRAAAQCEAEARAIGEVWNDSSRARVEQALMATGLDYAADTNERVAALVDRHAQTWSQTRLELCTDARQNHRWTTAQQELASRCLDSRRRALAALVEGLENVSSQTVSEAILAVAGLPSAAQCGQEVHLGAYETPTDPEQAAAVRAAEEEATRLKGMMTLGQPTPAAERIAPLLEKAEATGWQPMVARARLLAGELEAQRGQYDAAREHLERAFVAAVSSGQDPLAVEAAEKLAEVIGVDLSHHDEGVFWIDVGRGISQRGNVPTDGDLSRIEGILLHELGEVRASGEVLDRAIRLDEEAFGADHPFTAVTVQTRCNIYEAAGDYDWALDCHRRAAKMQQKFLGRRHPYVAVALHNLGGLHARRGELDDAQTNLEEAARIREETIGPDHPELAKTYANLAIVAAMRSDYEGAKRGFERALRIFEKALGPDEPVVASALGNLAQVELTLGNVERAREQCHRGLKIIEERLGPKHPELSQLMSVLAQSYVHTNDYESAERWYRRELALFEDREEADPVPAAEASISLASTLVERGGFEEALTLLHSAQDTIEEVLGSKHPLMTSVHSTRAKLYERQGSLELGLEHAEQALTLSEKQVGPDALDTLEILVRLGGLQLAADDPETAAASLRRATTGMHRYPNDPTRARAEFLLAKALWATGDRQAAGEHAAAALSLYEALGDAYSSRADEVRRWSARH